MDARTKKTARRMIPYGLCVLTAESKGNVAASTVNWVTHASFESPLVAVGVKAGSGAHELIKESKAFALNVLGEGRNELAFSFFKPLECEGDSIGGEAFAIGESGAGARQRGSLPRVQAGRYVERGRPLDLSRRSRRCRPECRDRW